MVLIRGSLRRARAGLLLTAGLVATGACAAPSSGPAGPVVSPTGIEYPSGTPPEDTRFSQTAALHLRQDRAERALELAREGIAAQPGNPIHYFVAATARLRMGDFRAADSLLDEAETIYPAYELEAEPLRMRAWAAAFNEGLDAYAEGKTDSTLVAWRKAITIYDREPDAHRNLGALLVAEGRFDEAIAVYRQGLEGMERGPASRVLDERERERMIRAREEMEGDLARLLLFADRHAEAEPLLRAQVARDPADTEARVDLAEALDAQGKDEEARSLRRTLLDEPELGSTELFDLGVALFRGGEPERAARAFRRLTERQPRSRDAWFNYANSLFAARSWAALAEAGDRLVEVDPLGENSALITARAYLETDREDEARRRLERIDAAPVHLEDLEMRPVGGATRLEGRVVGNAADPGSPVRLRITFFGRDGGVLGSEAITLRAPADGESEAFQVTFSARAAAYRYELVVRPAKTGARVAVRRSRDGGKTVA